MLWVHTNVRIGIVHTCGHVRVFWSSFCSSIRCFCSSVCASYDCISLCSSFYLPSVHLSDIPSVCMSVCMYVNMYLCRDERTSVCTVDIENWINLTDILSGLSLHWTLISFVFFLFFFRVAIQTTALPVCAPFYAKTMFTIAKKVHIYLWALTLYYSTSRWWQWRRVNPRVNPKPVITFYNCKICWHLKLCTKTYYDLTVRPSLFNRTWALRWKRCLDSSYVVHTGMFI